MTSIYGKTGEAWFWRSWPNEVTYNWEGKRESTRDFKLKSEAAAFTARNGGGDIRKMRFRGTNSTETRWDSIPIPAK